MNVLMIATPKEPPSCRIIPVKAAPSPICLPFNVLSDRVVIGMKSIPIATPRKISGQKKADLGVSVSGHYDPKNRKKKNINKPNETRYCCFTPL
jgi:hypothetical protein